MPNQGSPQHVRSACGFVLTWPATGAPGYNTFLNVHAYKNNANVCIEPCVLARVLHSRSLIHIFGCSLHAMSPVHTAIPRRWLGGT